MNRLRSLLTLAVLCILSSPLTGCIAVYTYKPTHATVYDAETSLPLAGAQVQVYYLYVLTLNAPKSTTVTTDQEGKAILQAATFAQEWKASAPGYLSDGPAGQWLVWEPREPITFFLYREPLPKITLVVPNGYHGPLKVDMRPVQGRVQERVGKRDFTFNASSTGYVSIEATPLLLKMKTWDIHAVFEDGRSIPESDYRIGPTDTALRWVTGNGNRTLFVVGTEHDVARIHPVIYTYINDDSHHIMLNEKAFNEMFDQSP